MIDPDKPIYEEERRLTWPVKLLIGAGCLGLFCFISGALAVFALLWIPVWEIVGW